MKKIVLILSAFIFCFSATTIAQSDLVDVAALSKDHTTLVASLKAADLVTTLKGEGPFTVFAPTNSAFEALQEGTVASLLEPENKDKLSSILTYHVVAGNFSASDVIAAIEKSGGTHTLTTVNGGVLAASLKDGNVILTDSSGNQTTITATDIKASNGVIHSIDSVVMPN